MYPLVDLVLKAHIPNATDATNQVLLIAPFDMKVVSIKARHRVASTSGTLDLVRAASGVAVSAGTSLLTATMANGGTADTNVEGSLKTGIADLHVNKGEALGLLFAGTLTNLEDLDVTVVARQLKQA